MIGRKTMKRIELIVAYDGTNYHGFARQNNALTIQEVLEKAVYDITHEKVEVISSGRTDTGVHAKAQCCIIDVATQIPVERLAKALNTRLPDDIVIKQARQVRDDFHPRFMAKRKTYRYQIYLGETRDPFVNKYSYFYPYHLDRDKVREAASYMVGTHDFICFCASGSSVKTTVRTIYSIEIQEHEELLTIDVCGNGFLYNMVRIIVGTLVEVGRGKIAPEYVKTIIEQKDRGNAGPTAPAKGLTLKEIDYEDTVRFKG